MDFRQLDFNEQDNFNPYTMRHYAREGARLYRVNSRYGTSYELDTKYATPRMYIINKLNDDNDNEVIWADKNRKVISTKMDKWSFIRPKWAIENIVMSNYFYTPVQDCEDGRLEMILPTIGYKSKNKYDTRCVFQDPGTVVERLIQLLLEQLDTDYIDWIDKDQLIFRIYKPREIHEAMNKGNGYLQLPTTTFSEFERQLNAYCCAGILTTISADYYTYMFNAQWYQNEINNTHQQAHLISVIDSLSIV